MFSLALIGIVDEFLPLQQTLRKVLETSGICPTYRKKAKPEDIQTL